MKKYIRKLQRVSTHSYVLNIPKEMVEEYGWREKQNIEIAPGPRKSLVIRDARSKK